MPNPFDNEELYDVIVLAGERSPGLVKLSGHDREAGWDVKRGDGQKGASMTLKDAPPVKFSATFTLLKDPAQEVDDFEAWDAFQKIIDSSTADPKNPKALDIYHPDLARNDIRSVVKGKVGGMQHDGKGVATVVVEFLEYSPPKSIGGSPSGSKSKNPNDTKKKDPNQDLQDELAKLTKQWEATPWG